MNKAPTARPTRTRSAMLAGLIVFSALGEATGSAAAEAKPTTKLPDWTGVWNPSERNIFDPTTLPPIPKNAAGYFPESSYAREYPPYTPGYEARYIAVLKRTAEGFATDPVGSCLPPGFPRLMGTPFPLEFVLEAGRVTILFEAWSQTRRIWTDGRPHPTDPDPSYNGHSIGHWEGDTLVIDTVGMRDDTTYDVTGAPHSDALHVMERMRKRDPETIEDVITVEDRKAFTKPWTVTRTYGKRAGWEIAEYVCEENQRNPPNADGTTGVVMQTGAPAK
jgi:hypothetical protein